MLHSSRNTKAPVLLCKAAGAQHGMQRHEAQMVHCRDIRDLRDEPTKLLTRLSGHEEISE